MALFFSALLTITHSFNFNLVVLLFSRDLQTAFISMISFDLHENPVGMERADVISPFVQRSVSLRIVT